MQKKTYIPDGYEIDKKKSTFEMIIFKKITPKKALCVKDIPNRDWCVDSMGIVYKEFNCNDLNNVSNEKRAYAHLALMQLVELRDNWNDGWVADWSNGYQEKFCIYFNENNTTIDSYISRNIVLNFKDQQTAKEFLEQFKELIETAKELL